MTRILFPRCCRLWEGGLTDGVDNRRESMYRRMTDDLANAGWGLLLGSMVLLSGVVLSAVQYGSGILLGAAFGGAVGLGFALKFPSNPARAGYVFARLPKQLSTYEQQLRGELLRRRRRALVAWIVAPYLLGLLIWGTWGWRTGPVIDIGGQASSALISAIQMASLAWSIQYLQVLSALRRDRDQHRNE